MKNLLKFAAISILLVGVFRCSAASPEKAAVDARVEAAHARVVAADANARVTAADAHVKAADAGIVAASRSGGLNLGRFFISHLCHFCHFQTVSSKPADNCAFMHSAFCLSRRPTSSVWDVGSSVR